MLAVDSFYLFFVSLFYLSDGWSVVIFDFSDATLIILFADFGLYFFLKSISQFVD